MWALVARMHKVQVIETSASLAVYCSVRGAESLHSLSEKMPAEISLLPHGPWSCISI